MGILSALFGRKRVQKQFSEMTNREIAETLAMHAGNRAAEFKGQIIMALKQNGAQLQSELVKQIALGDTEDRMLFYAASAQLEEQGRITREKHGRSYMLRLAEQNKLE